MSIKNKTVFLERLKGELKSLVAEPLVMQLDNLAKEEKLNVEDRLFISILLNNKEMVENLLKVGADANATNKQGTSLLQLALAFEREDVAHLLLKYGAMPSFENNKKFKI